MPLFYSVAQPALLNYPTVYEGPDVVFRQIDEHLWVGSGNLASSESLYIVEGEERAVLIDTGTRIPRLDKIVESITAKPYEVILTHVHQDHAGSCANFDEIWLCEYDEASLPEMDSDFDGEVKYLKDGQVFDLGFEASKLSLLPDTLPVP